MKATLTADEKAQLSRLEAVVEAGVKVTLPLIEAGKALAEIRRRQLYRDTAGSWDEYVQARFRITRRRADQLAAFAGVQEALEETGNPVPVFSEKAARPLVGLAKETVVAVVAEAAASPEGVTPETIRKAAAKRKPKAAKAARPVRFKVPGWVIVATPNRKATGTVLEALASAMRQLEAKATEAA